MNEALLGSGGAQAFLSELFAFEREIEERAPNFWDYCSLHVEADPAHPELAAFCERVRDVFGSSLLPVSGRDALNAVDLAFRSRIDGLWQTAVRECAAVDDRQLRALHGRLAAARAAREQRVARMPGSLECIETDSGLMYYALGNGTPIILLNAIGQGLHFWFRLIDALTPGHRVAAFETRGTIDEQIRDINAIRAHERAGRCTLVGWCTGPKVAVEFALRDPDAVHALVFLNPTFRCDGTEPALETAYERSSDPLFRAVAARPAMARSVMHSLQSCAAPPPIDPEDDERAAADVVAAMSAALRPHVARPFRSEEVLVEYTRQILDFWSYDTLTKVDQLSTPLLVIASELDRVAAPEMAREVARRFRGAELLTVPYGTHYCLHDRPEYVAELIERFLEGRR